jgi:hypothetical protein
MSQAFDLISSEYGWHDEVILDLPMRRIRQIVAAINVRKLSEQTEHRKIVSWQTRSIAMVMAATVGEDKLMEFAANLTIDREELEQFSGEPKVVKKKSNVPVNASTQESQAKKNFDIAADKNNFETLMMFGQGMEKGKPGH